ncbi:MAG: 23S rRNA (adenine(2503)-C(2))-methyltransferase RlmN [Clostridia bacterium]|nr:23S rRNA (adenine(2503)-C(2))-methyltransferase RlmN [Clostridia bacterium]
MKKELLHLFPDELKQILTERGIPGYRAEQITQFAYAYVPFEEMSNLPKDLRLKLSEEFTVRTAEAEATLVSKDGTVKYLTALPDGNRVECVFMRHDYGDTLCLSTQVGCRMGCKFCASGQYGLVRNLSAAEMLGEVLLVNSLQGGTPKKRAITNLVLMGCGEPFDNYDNTVRFLRLVSQKEGINISCRNISLSTCGLLDRLEQFINEGLPVTLAISLHAAIDAKRKEVMPIANKYTVQQTAEAAKHYANATGRRVIFEYALMHGFNDTEEDISAIKKLTLGFSCHVNLIPLNEVKESSLKGVTRAQAQEFLQKLTKRGVSATLRRTTGADISGSCGQLRQKYMDGDKK